MKEEARGAGTQRGPQHGQQEMQEDGDALGAKAMEEGWARGCGRGAGRDTAHVRPELLQARRQLGCDDNWGATNPWRD